MIIPMLTCRDAAAEVAFCRDAFCATEISRRTAPDGRVLHAALRVGAGMVMIHDESPHLASRAPDPDGSSSVVIYHYVPDADVVIARALAAGARLLLPAADQSWGDRVGRIVDPAGHVWNIATTRSAASRPPTSHPPA